MKWIASRTGLFTGLLIVALMLPASPAERIFDVFNIGPNGANFATTYPGSSDSAGRIMSLVINPTIPYDILYAASESSGVWKSISGVRFLSAGQNSHLTPVWEMKWKQASIGLRSGITANNTSLTIDSVTPTRLLYATANDDGRPTASFGTSFRPLGIT